MVSGRFVAFTCPGTNAYDVPSCLKIVEVESSCLLSNLMLPLGIKTWIVTTCMISHVVKDHSSLRGYVTLTKFKMEMISLVLELIRKVDAALSIDLKDT